MHHDAHREYSASFRSRYATFKRVMPPLEGMLPPSKNAASQRHVTVRPSQGVIPPSELCCRSPVNLPPCESLSIAGNTCCRIIFGLFGYFVFGGSPTLFGLGRGPTTPPDPAMVRMDRKDLNSNKTKKKNLLPTERSAPLFPDRGRALLFTSKSRYMKITLHQNHGLHTRVLQRGCPL